MGFRHTTAGIIYNNFIFLNLPPNKQAPEVRYQK
jgi:hypothetical protein